MATAIVPISGVYLITCTTNNKIYIGSSVNITRRWHWHKTALRRRKHHSVLLQRAWNKYGEECFTFSVLEKCKPSECLKREQVWLDALCACDPSRGYNTARNTSAPTKGRAISAEHRAKIGAAHKGMKRPPEHGRKISEARKGKPLSEEHRAKLSAAHKGKKQSPELIAKRTRSTPARKQSVERVERRSDVHRKHYIVTSPEGVETQIFGLYRFCRDHGLQGALMSKVARGERTHHKGWKCRFE